MAETAFDRGDGGAGKKAPHAKPGGDVPAEGETVDRDALHPADYGGRRDAETEENRQGGVTADEADGGGRAPTGERDRDDDPDGDRLGR